MKKLLRNKYVILILIIINELMALCFLIFELSPGKDFFFAMSFFTSRKTPYIIEFFVILAVVGVSDYFVWKAINLTSKNDSLEKRLKQSEYESKAAYDYYLESVKITTSTRKFRHDFNNNINTIYALSKENTDKSRTTCKQLLDKLNGSLSELQTQMEEIKK